MSKRKVIELPVVVPSARGKPTFLLVDSPVTKRKSFSFVLDNEQQVLYATADVGDCIDWLLTNEVFSITLVTATRDIEVIFNNLSQEKES